MISDLDLAFEQVFWLYLIPLIWLAYFKLRTVKIVWPQWLPVIQIRYPLLNTIYEPTADNQKSSKQPANKNFFIALAFTLFLLSLAQPVQYTGLITEPEKKQPIDIIFAVDTALSMSLKDYLINAQSVSRIDMAKLLLADYISHYSGAHLALVVLGNPPALWLPLTSDRAVVENEVQRLTTFLGGRITDMGETFKLIEDRFTDTGYDNDKVVVVISDGGTQVGSVSPQDAASNLAAKGFSVYVIALGATQAPNELLDSSSLLYEPVNLTMLEEVAQKGKGQLFHVLDVQSFNQALERIQQLHKKQSDSSRSAAALIHDNKLSRALFILPLLLAMFLLLWVSLQSSGRNTHAS